MPDRDSRRVEIRPARPDDVDAAIEMLRSVNPTSSLTGHSAHLKTWAEDPGACLLVGALAPAAAAGDARIVAMALALRGRADEGAGPRVPGLVHVTGIAVSSTRQAEAWVAACWTPCSRMPVPKRLAG